jgi:hypothetical protein
VFIEDFYTPEQLKIIKDEVKNILPFVQSDFKASCKLDDSNNKISKKTGKSIWIYDLAQKINLNEDIIKLGRKIFSNEIYEAVEKISIHWKGIRLSGRDGLLVNYYADGEEYEAHEDNTLFTCISFLKIGDFEGGDLIFPEFNERIKFKENCTVIFPGCLTHKAEKIKAKKNNYRVTFCTFVNHL